MLRGFKVPLHLLDAFLTANGIPEEHERLCTGVPPFYDEDSDRVTTLLRQKAGDAKTRLFMPYKQDFSLSFTAYIAYDWIMAFAQRKIKPDELSQTPSAAFEDLRRELLSHSKGAGNDEEFQNEKVVYRYHGWAKLRAPRVSGALQGMYSLCVLYKEVGLTMTLVIIGYQVAINAR